MMLDDPMFSQLPHRSQARVMGDVLSSADVGKALKLSQRTVIRHMKSGLLPGEKVGEVWRCRRDELERFLKAAAEEESAR